MYIRGVDFSRGNVLVGLDSEAPAPAGQNQSQLQNRAVLEARVVAAAGGEATLDIEGERVVVQSHVSLNIGDKLFVRVSEQLPPAVGLRLSLLTSEPESGTSPTLAEAAVDDLLRDLGVPADPRTRALARALLARDGALDRPALTKLQQDLRGFPQVSAREANAAALLQRAGAPVTSATVAVMAARAEPDAPPNLGMRLALLTPGLEALARGNSRLAGAARELLTLLRGLPLDGGAGRVAIALHGWLDKLTPPEAKRPTNEGAFSPEASEAENQEQPRPTPPIRLAAGASPLASRNTPAHADLPDMLGRLRDSLGSGHQALKGLLSEAVAEARFVQLANSGQPPAAGPQPSAYMVPLLTPQLSPEHPETQLQVHVPPRKAGEALDPDNMRIDFVVETQNLNTVQADLRVKDGIISLALGVADPGDRAFLEEHLSELQTAIANQGFQTAHLLARIAKTKPPRIKQAEGLGEVVHFDRRI